MRALLVHTSLFLLCAALTLGLLAAGVDRAWVVPIGVALFMACLGGGAWWRAARRPF